MFGDQKPDKYNGIQTSLLVYEPPKEPVDCLLNAVSPPGCDELCLVATGGTAVALGGLTATACPAGTVAAFGVGAAVACGGLAASGAAATKSETRTDSDGVDGGAILCSMATAGVVPPGTDLNVLVRPIVTKVVGGLVC